MIVVIDYNVGNVKSVCNAFRYIGCDVQLSCEPEAIDRASGLVLPGVAAFGFAINALGASAELVKRASLSGKPLLGICVGFHAPNSRMPSGSLISALQCFHPVDLAIKSEWALGYHVTDQVPVCVGEHSKTSSVATMYAPRVAHPDALERVHPCDV